MAATSVTSSSFPRKSGHIQRAVDHLKHYLTYPVTKSGQVALALARKEFPGRKSLSLSLSIALARKEFPGPLAC